MQFEVSSVVQYNTMQHYSTRYICGSEQCDVMQFYTERTRQTTLPQTRRTYLWREARFPNRTVQSRSRCRPERKPWACLWSFSPMRRRERTFISQYIRMYIYIYIIHVYVYIYIYYHFTVEVDIRSRLCELSGCSFQCFLYYDIM